MVYTDRHLSWLMDTGISITTIEGKTIKVLEFNHQRDEVLLSEWAKHFRNHYCLDTEIDFHRRGFNYTRKDYLNFIKLPDPSLAPGPSIRAGDFGEVLTSDYLEYVLNYWIPRTRYSHKTIRNESTKGSDIIGFKTLTDDQDSLEDTLAIFEAKTQFSGREPKSRLQDAINDSAKDHARRGESLNAIKQRLFDKNMIDEATRIERFQNLEDRPYNEVFGAVALFSSPLFDGKILERSETKDHPNSQELNLLVIHGPDMMDLVHELYRRAADEA
jgi:hypothetical protein